MLAKRATKVEKPTNWYAHALLVCLMLAAPAWLRGQNTNYALTLQNNGIGKIDQWLDYVRRTGDAKSTVSQLAAAENDLNTSVGLFMMQNDNAAASLSEIKIAAIERMLNRWGHAVPAYQKAVEFAKLANRRDYQTEALADMAYSELQLGDADIAEQHAREAVRVGADCGNKGFYFDALDRAAEIEVKRGNLVAAGDYLDRALGMSNEIADKKKLYSGYSDRGDIYYQNALKCDYQRTYEVCYQSLELARADYQKAAAITRELGYTYFTQLFEGLLKGLDERKALIQSTEHGDQTAIGNNLFNPQKPKDVLVTESFAYGAMDPSTVAFVEKATKEMRDWQGHLQQQGFNVQNLNPSDLCLEGQVAEMKGDNDAALASFRRADELLEQDRRHLSDEQARGRFMEDKLSCYYRPALILLDRKRYAEAFAIFERSRSRAMADLLANRPLTFKSGKEQQLFSQLQTLKTNIAAQQEKLFNLTGGQDRDKKLQQIMDLQNKISSQQQQFEQLEIRIAKEAPKLKQLTAAQATTLVAVQQSAAENGYDILYYVVMEHALILWHINGNAVEVKNVFLPHAQLIKKTAALHESLIARRDTADASFDDDTSRQLFLYLIQPALASIRNRHLMVIPHEELNSIPFQALQDPTTGKYLGESFAISYAPSATVLADLDNQSSLTSGRLLAVADPSIHEAADEANAIGRLYVGRSKVVSQEPAHKADVQGWVSNYDIVHLSVHGKFNSSDPMLSYLQFSEDGLDNGRLTAAEMFGLPLQKNAFVVLSACETGRVEAMHSNEVLGMVRSLLYAGANRLVLSGWEVNAGSTRLWMETFYQKAQTSHPAEAARLALIAVKSRPEYSHPFFWAPFVMTGK